MDVKTAGRTIEIFEVFAQSQEPLSLSEIARALDAPMSSCLYLIRTLERLGYLYAVGPRRNLYPTRKMFDIASTITRAEPWMQRIEPTLQKLRDETKETIILGKRQANHVVYLAVHEGLHTIRFSARTGDLKPLHSSAIGKALLSALTPAERSKTLSKLTLDAITATTITDKSALLEDLEQTASRGHSESRGENVADVMAIAKPFSLGNDVYAIAIAGPIYRVGKAVKEHSQSLDAACKEIVSPQVTV